MLSYGITESGKSIVYMKVQKYRNVFLKRITDLQKYGKNYQLKNLRQSRNAEIYQSQ